MNEELTDEQIHEIMFAVEEDPDATKVQFARAIIAADRAQRVPDAKPVAWGAFYFGGVNNGKLYAHCSSEAEIEGYILQCHRSNDSITLRAAPLYTAPAPSQPERKPMTDDEIIDLANEVHRAMPDDADDQAELLAIVREVEAFHKI